MKSDIKNIPIYQEAGRFFLPDGTLDEAVFKKFIHEKLVLPGDTSTGRETASAWLNKYLSGMLAYLNEKNLSDSSANMLRIAVDECNAAGIHDINLTTDMLSFLLTHTTLNRQVEEKKSSPDEKRDRIFEAAVEVFAGKGYHRATMDEIAARAGIAKGSLYRHFKSKEELLRQLLSRKYSELAGLLGVILADTGLDVFRQIEEMIRVMITFIADNHVLYRLIQNEAIASNIGTGQTFYDYFVEQFPMLKERIFAMNRDRSIMTEDFYTVFYGILGFIDGVVHKWFHDGMSYPLTDEVPLIKDILFRGIAGRNENV